MTSTLTISHLTKSFGEIVALSDINVNIEAGERVALLGHNGAGKSTLMKISLGLLEADSGTVDVCGHVPGSSAARNKVSYLSENVSFHPSVTGQEQISHLLRMRNMPAAGASDLLRRVGLDAAANRRIGTYSKGMRQRLGLAQALIGSPKLFVLDEPMSGLDPVSRREFYGLLDKLAADGASILMSSHALTEVEAQTDRLLILAKGKLVAEGSLQAMRARAELPINIIVTPLNGYAVDVAEALPEAVRVGNDYRIMCSQNDKLSTLTRITALGEKVHDLDIFPPSLEDIYSSVSKVIGNDGESAFYSGF